ncbi:MAG: hypothetical protein IJA10_10890 [Lachnospiraceae bacterium]|nr:hypothetical protein [Lachnospiraceae bacterium]
MVVKDLIEYVFDTIVIYTEDVSSSNEYTDLYIGDIRYCNEELLNRKICSIGATCKGFLDIRVE